MRSHKRGFTLVELLVVIAIIGILASITTASLIAARERARDAKRISDLRTLQISLEQYFDRNGGYPSALSVLQGTEISVIPTDPTTGAAYLYAPRGANCEVYHLGAYLEREDHDELNRDVDSAAQSMSSQCPDQGGSTSKTDFAGGGAGENGDDPDEPIYDLLSF